MGSNTHTLFEEVPMKAIMLIALTSILSTQETDAKDLTTTTLSYIGNSKPVATCKVLDDSAKVSVLELTHLVKRASSTPIEVKAFVGEQGKRLGVDSVAVSTVEKSKSGSGYSQTFYLVNGLTSYSVQILCEWPSSVVVSH